MGAVTRCGIGPRPTQRNKLLQRWRQRPECRKEPNVEDEPEDYHVIGSTAHVAIAKPL
jgi:hypothetical protein